MIISILAMYHNRAASIFLLHLTLIFCAAKELASAADRLPYAVRTKNYSTWGTSVKGDIRTVGMAGATVGLADTYIAALDNPSGLGMTLNGADFNLSTGRIYDGWVQNSNPTSDQIAQPVDYFNVGAALSQYPWALSLGYIVSTEEDQLYDPATAPFDTAQLAIRTRELYASAARTLFNNRLSIGASLILGQAYDAVNFSSSTRLDHSYYSYSVGGTLGASWKLPIPHRVILGLSYKLPMNYSIETPAGYTNEFPGFFQSVSNPSRLGLGLGWIPNRFLRADFSTFIIGSTPGVALLRDDSISLGESSTIQPRIGFAYYFADYKELKATAFLGSYYEVSRIQGLPNRLHATTGIEVKPWIFSLGLGLDTSRNFENYIFSFGIDVFRVMEKLDIIPPVWRPPYHGFLPSPLSRSDEGLARPLVKKWNPIGSPLDPIEVGLAIPEKIEKKAVEFSNDIIKAFQIRKDTEPSKTGARSKIKKSENKRIKSRR
jgi:hypothetical protein